MKKDKKDKKEEKEDKKDKKDTKKDEKKDAPGPATPVKPVTSGLPNSASAEALDKARADEEAKRRAEDEKKRADEKRKKEEEDRKRQEDEKRKQAEVEKAKQAEKEKAQKNDEKKPLPPKPAEKKPEENVESEIQSLESAKLDPSEKPSAYKDVYNILGSDVYAAYDKLQGFARELNTQFSTPEIVVIGKKSHGKSSVIEAFFGEALNAVGTSGVTKRPIFLNVINNMNAANPKITVKRDSALKEFDHDKEVSLKDLHTELASRNKLATDEPIIVQYESAKVCNMTFIDTPGLLDENESDSTKDEREQLVIKLAKPSHRIIIAVEACRDWARMDMVNFVKKVDPELSRTIFVYNKFNTHLQGFTSTREVNKFLSQTLPDVKTFFVTLPTGGVRDKFSESDKFQNKIYQAYRRDINALEQLQFDKRYESFIGVHALRKYVLNLTWKSYQESIPRILKQFRAKKVESERKIKEVEHQQQSLDNHKLRSIASNYVVNFLQVVEKLISGTSEGNPSVNGQTLEEEKSSCGMGDWVDLYNQPTRFEPEEWKIPYWDNKIYGGQQFERLLAEFKAISGRTAIPEVTGDDIATAAGISKLNNVPNYAWAASDLAQQKSQDAFVPLIEQLTSRAVYIMKRLTEISEKVLEGRKKKYLEDMGFSSTDDVDRYPYFTYHVKDLYFKFVDNAAKICKEKCLDEFYSTKTIYWDLTSEYSDRQLPLERNDLEDTKTAVVHLATELFSELRDRITRNVLLKFYNFFLVPMQNELWNEIQGKVNTLPESALEQIFEVQQTKDKLKDTSKQFQEELNKLAEKDKQFMHYAAAFSKRVD